MTGKKLFSSLDHSFSSSIKLGDKKTLKVIVKGDMAVPTKRGTMKVKNIYFASNLKHSLLSVGQMLENNYKLVFEDKMCKIYDKNKGGRLVTIVKMNKNKFFSIKFVEQGGGFAFVSIDDNANLWHLRFGHLNFQSLKLYLHLCMVCQRSKILQKFVKGVLLESMQGDTFQRMKHGGPNLFYSWFIVIFVDHCKHKV